MCVVVSVLVAPPGQACSAYQKPMIFGLIYLLMVLFLMTRDGIFSLTQDYSNKSQKTFHSIFMCTADCTVVRLTVQLYSTVQLSRVSGLWCSVPGQSWVEHQLLSLSHPES